jgi:hypothetical protein
LLTSTPEQIEVSMSGSVDDPEIGQRFRFENEPPLLLGREAICFHE